MLVAEGPVLILSQDFHHVPLLDIFDLSFALGVRECLSDWVVLHLLLLNELAGDLAVRFSLSLEILLGFSILVDTFSPIIVAVGQAEVLVCFLKSVTLHLPYFSLNITI